MHFLSQYFCFVLNKKKRNKEEKETVDSLV